ncbi:MAG: hypothetical protein HYS05_15865 [Acidobacteria bacterium]|nr:hypothetical protein [Acidobacteriota bacterium]
MSVDLKSAFRLSFVTGETELPIPPVSEILARVRSGPVWDGASIAPADDEFPLLHIIRIDAFPRETVWEGREGREAWERANSATKHDV